MKGNDKIIDKLNFLLADELTAISQYMVHAAMCDNWGYEKLHDAAEKRAIDEMKHAEGLIERLLFLDGTPKMDLLALTIGANVKEMIESDLKAELGAIALYNEIARIAAEEKDNGTRDLFIEHLKDEEGHADWLEIQVHQIADIGLERYLVAQTIDGE